MKTNNVLFLDGKNKICPLCKTVNPGKDIFRCKKCNTWIPHLNTSWVRSVTNLLLVKRILEIISEKKEETFSKEDLVKVLVERKVIKVDMTRANDPRYWSGSPNRRASEYIQIFKYLGIIRPAGNKNFSITKIGKKILETEKRIDFTNLCTLFITHFDPSNKFVEKRYKNLKANYLLLALDLINELKKQSKEIGIEHVGLAFLCGNKEDYESAKGLASNYSAKELQQTFWGNSKELNRVVKGVFVRWLEQSRLIEIDRNPRHFKIKLTNFGEKILDRYSSNLFKTDEISLFELMSDEKDDIYVNKEIISISDLLISTTEEKDRFKLTLNIRRNVTQKTGGAWETYVFNHLSNLDLDPKWYKQTQDFVNIKLSNSVLNALTGGTQHNPDIILYNPLFLVDPKDDVNKEMYKVQAYDGYATHEGVNGNALIVSKELMGKEQAERLSDLKRTNVIDKEALDLLVNNKTYLDRDSIFKILGYECKFGQYISEEVVLDRIDSLV